MEVKLSIVILNYNRAELLSKRMMEMIANIPHEGVEVVVVDNGSTDETALKIFEWWKNSKLSFPAKFYHIDKNQGFCGGMNFGINASNGKIVLCLSNDVQVCGNSLCQTILDIFDKDDKILLGGRIIDWNSGWNTFVINGKSYTVPYCEGYAVAMTKQSWEVVDYFDTLYYPYDYEDVDLSMKALQAGLKLTSFPSEMFIHAGGQTINSSDRIEVTKVNMQKFIDKWQEHIPSILGGDNNATK
jgi:GT2 family glycosyltransferase